MSTPILPGAGSFEGRPPHDAEAAPTEVPAELPAEARVLEGGVTLRDGSRVHVRPIRAEDTERLQAFHAHLSSESVTYRFFRYMPELSVEEARRFTHLDYNRQMALIATFGTGAAEYIIGVVRYSAVGEHSAEVAFVVADEWQGRGIASLLFSRLAGYARKHGMTTFVAETLATNTRMLGLFHHCGFPATFRYRQGEYEVRMDITAPMDEAPDGRGSPRVATEASPAER